MIIDNQVTLHESLPRLHWVFSTPVTDSSYAMYVLEEIHVFCFFIYYCIVPAYLLLRYDIVMYACTVVCDCCYTNVFLINQFQFMRVVLVSAHLAQPILRTKRVRVCVLV